MRNFRAYVTGLLLIPVVAVGALFIIPGPDGNPLMNMGRLRQSLGSVELSRPLIEKAKRTYYSIKYKIKKINVTDTLPEKAKNVQKSNEMPEAPSETLYKWYDKRGNLHFSNQKPPDSVEFEIVE